MNNYDRRIQAPKNLASAINVGTPYIRPVSACFLFSGLLGFWARGALKPKERGARPARPPWLRYVRFSKGWAQFHPLGAPLFTCIYVSAKNAKVYRRLNYGTQVPKLK